MLTPHIIWLFAGSLYCILLLTALFGSSCYWEPIATELLLQRNPQLVHSTSPEANVTSLVELVGEAVQLTSNSSFAAAPKSPSILHTTVYERCWCDVAASIFLSAVAIHDRLSPLPTPIPPESATPSPKLKRKDWKSPIALFPPSGFFDPYDQAAWESASLVRHARQLMPPQDDNEEAVDSTNTTSVEEAGRLMVEDKGSDGASDKPGVAQKGFGGLMHRLSEYKPRLSGEDMRHYWSCLTSMPAAVQSAWNRSPLEGQTSGGKEESPAPLPTPPSNASESQIQTSAPSEPETQLPVPFSGFWIKSWRAAAQFFRQKHDLTPYGVPVIVDFGWSRQA
ncbi:hypothetical protein M407DRAFT_178278 [Tulasnella calospora MUT 4182]|uniref:Uncharacterized protein n=1 Tax=Tulasnella calospora MUT 4182 TaxID=1051891 RepID=A0A0C3QLZ3_9AGAM|nr:hypothetical protein M407DRAFT_178278 [Tulasnella calospora MUT 4182]